MRIRHIAVGLALAAGLNTFGAATAALADDPVRVPLDTETVIGGVGVACTGIGQTKDDPKWKAYPIRVEFADATRAYLANEVVTVSAVKGQPLLTVACDGPWVLLRPPGGGAYQVEGRLAERDTLPHSTVVKAPKHGQAIFVISFPDAH